MRDLRERIYGDRVEKIRQRAAVALEQAKHIGEWLTTLPEAVQASSTGESLGRSVAVTLDALAPITELQAGPYAKQWADDARRLMAAATGAMMQTVAIADSVYNAVHGSFPLYSRLEEKRRGKATHWHLGVTSNLLLQDLRWLHRVRAEVDPEAATAKHRTQRHRARRKAGFEVKPAELHKSDLDLLRRAGLLRSPGKGQPKNTPDEITEALQTFLAACFAALTPEQDDLDRRNGDRPASAEDMWPVLGLMRRLRSLADI